MHTHWLVLAIIVAAVILGTHAHTHWLVPEEVGHATNCVIIHVTFLKFFLMLNNCKKLLLMSDCTEPD